MPGTKNVIKPTLIDSQKVLLPPVTHKTRGNEEVCQNFGQEWSLLSVPHAELSTAATGKSERGLHLDPTKCTTFTI